jgi:hypothetical protein
VIKGAERKEALSSPMMRSMPTTMEWLELGFQQIHYVDFVMIYHVLEAFFVGGCPEWSQEATEVKGKYLSFMTSL